MFETITYADGFGNWHAIVEDTAGAYDTAHAAILEQLTERASDWGETFMADVLHDNLVEVAAADAGTLHFKESHPDDVVIWGRES